MISTLPRGTAYLRSVIALVAAANGDPVEYARNRFGDRSATLTKAAQGAGSIGSGDWGSVLATPEATELTGTVVQQSIVGKAGLRMIPLNTRLVSATSEFAAYWVGPGQAKPLSRMDFAGDSLPPLKIAGDYINTQELFRSMSSEAEAMLRNEMTLKTVKGIDEAIIDPSNSGIPDVKPASVTNDVVGIASSGKPGSDVAALIADFDGDLMNAVFVTDPITAAQIALARDAGGSFQFPDASPRGGSVIGMPLVVSRSSPYTSAGGQIALIDGSGIVFGVEGVRMAVSDQATVECLDDPTNNSVTPIATTMVSTWQTNSVIVKIEIGANWRVVRSGSVSLVTGASYATAAP